MLEIKPGIYLHYKGSNAEVIGLARHSETLEELVVYKHYSQDFGPDALWVRPKKMFLENVTVGGQEIPRFKFLTPNSLAT